MRRYAHHGAVAISNQHIVADPDFDLLASQGMSDEQAGWHALLFHRCHVGFNHAAEFAFFDKFSQRRIVARSVGCQFMFRRDRAKRHAHDGVRARGEDPQLAVGAVDIVREGEAHAS